MKRAAVHSSRRRFLKGAGVCIALPVLDSLRPRRARAEASEVPQRLVVIGHPNGTTQRVGTTDVPEELLERLAPVQGRYTIVKNINNNGLKNTQQATGTGTPHSACFHGFLSGQVHPGIGDERKTFDQILAEDPCHHGSRLASLSINCAKRPSSQLGVPQDWFNTWAWQGPGQPVPMQHDPRVVFESLFAGFEPEDDPILRARLERKQLYLDAVVDQIVDLQPKLNPTDKQRLDQFLTGVEELDRKTATLLDGGGLLQCTVGAAPEIDLPVDTVSPPEALYPEIVTLMNELVVLALQCDATRLITFAHASPAGGGSVTGHGFVDGLEGIEKGWHPLSHWNAPYGNLSNDQELNRRDFGRVIAWHYDRVVELVQQLESTTATDGRPLLDDTLVCFGSWQGAGVHRVAHLYQLLFGGGGAGFAEGQVISANPGEDTGSKNIADLWLTVMRGFGQDVESLGIGQSGIDELLV